MAGRDDAAAHLHADAVLRARGAARAGILGRVRGARARHRRCPRGGGRCEDALRAARSARRAQAAAFRAALPVQLGRATSCGAALRRASRHRRARPGAARGGWRAGARAASNFEGGPSQQHSALQAVACRQWLAAGNTSRPCLRLSFVGYSSTHQRQTREWVLQEKKGRFSFWCWCWYKK